MHLSTLNILCKCNHRYMIFCDFFHFAGFWGSFTMQPILHSLSLLNYIPLYMDIKQFCISIHQFWILRLFLLCLLWVILLWTFVYKFCLDIYFLSLGIHLRVGFLGHIILYLICWVVFLLLSYVFILYSRCKPLIKINDLQIFSPIQ